MKYLTILCLLSSSLFADDSFTQGKENFELVKKKLLETYYKRGISESQLYEAATRGLLQYFDPQMSEWNQLLSPTEYKEMEADMQGKIVGAGIEMSFHEKSGMAEVLDLIPDSPAQKAGILPGDQILSVDGQLYKGKELRDMVYAIRGKVGQRRRLGILRGDKVLHKTIQLQSIPYANVQSLLLSDGIGYLGIHYFTGSTAGQVKKALESLSKKKIKALVVDLRGNAGGLLTASTQTASYLLPEGKTILQIKRHDGSKEEQQATGPTLLSVPMAVLINQQTKSGAEVVAAALKEGAHATLVGTQSFGKWNIQTMDPLPNAFVMKYTIGLMYPPSGTDLAGKGLTPDLPVSLPEDKLAKWSKIQDGAERVAIDAQLRTAVTLLQEKI